MSKTFVFWIVDDVDAGVLNVSRVDCQVVCFLVVERMAAIMVGSIIDYVKCNTCFKVEAGSLDFHFKRFFPYCNGCGLWFEFVFS